MLLFVFYVFVYFKPSSARPTAAARRCTTKVNTHRSRQRWARKPVTFQSATSKSVNKHENDERYLSDQSKSKQSLLVAVVTNVSVGFWLMPLRWVGFIFCTGSSCPFVLFHFLVDRFALAHRPQRRYKALSLLSSPWLGWWLLMMPSLVSVTSSLTNDDI